MTKRRKRFAVSAGFLAAFAALTWAVCFVDVQSIGPQDSCVGFAGVNRFVHDLTGVHFALYTITDWLGLIPAGICAGFGVFGLVQWIRRRSIRKVDRDILALGGFYIAVMAAYVLFEIFPVNYRPVLIENRLESSYPSSTTMLAMCVMPTALMQLNMRIRSRTIRSCIAGVIIAFTAFMVVGRLISGVHWFTDIVGGALLSAGLVTLYDSVSGTEKKSGL